MEHDLLSNKLFLITRPASRGEGLVRLLSEAGGECILFPTLDITVFPFQRVVSQLGKIFNLVDKVIFTSVHAVQERIVDLCYAEIFSRATVLAIGGATAEALRQKNVNPIVPRVGEHHSEGLLALPMLQQVAGQCIVVFSGAGGRALLERHLRKRGAQVMKISVYRRGCPVRRKFPPVTRVSYIISTSQESLSNLWQMAGIEGQPWLKEQHLVVISHAMKALAIKLGFVHPPIVSQGASDEAIYEAIVSEVGSTCDSYPLG